MGRLSLLTGVLLGYFAVLLLVGAEFAGNAAAQGKAKDEPKTTELHLLEKNGGANFGDWAVWRYEEGGAAIFLINQKTGYAIYLPWSSNGWINYRTKDGDWHVLFSKGEPEPQKRDDYTFKDWTVKVTKDLIDFHNSTHDDRMTIRRSTGEFIHNGRAIGGK
jgi:hypothetical protein